jgi:hypothetical protein
MADEWADHVFGVSCEQISPERIALDMIAEVNSAGIR